MRLSGHWVLALSSVLVSALVIAVLLVVALVVLGDRPTPIRVDGSFPLQEIRTYDAWTESSRHFSVVEGSIAWRELWPVEYGNHNVLQIHALEPVRQTDLRR